MEGTLSNAVRNCLQMQDFSVQLVSVADHIGARLVACVANSACCMVARSRLSSGSLRPSLGLPPPRS